MYIPFTKPYITKKEYLFMKTALQENMLSGDKKWTELCHNYMVSKFNTIKALLTTSCSSALDMTTFLLNLKVGDEVIIPSFNFVSMANSIVARGATPVFVDVDKNTLCIDLEDFERKINKNTKAVYPVHYAGISCDMDQLIAIACEHNLFVVEDAAQAFNAKYKDSCLGTIGDFSCFSFHETKNITCGEGGALLINKNEKLAERAEYIREKGTNRNNFIRGQIDKYTWVDIGSSYLPSDILAALLYAQFENIENNSTLREKNYKLYCDLLKPLEDADYIKLPFIPQYSTTNYHIFYIILDSKNNRDELMNCLRNKGVMASFHYIPLHLSPMGKKYGKTLGNIENTVYLSDRQLRLPLYCDLKENEIEYIVDIINTFFNK